MKTMRATFVAGLLVTAGPLWAAESPVDQAREEFVLGAALAKRGQWMEALAAFERSAALRPHPVTTYNLGYCERALARYTRARKRFVQALAEHEAASSGAMPEAMRTHALSYLEDVERKIARRMVTLDPPNATIAVDGRPLEVESGGAVPVLVAGTRTHGPGERAPAHRFELRLDPGSHVFVLTPPGPGKTVRTIDLEPGSSGALRLEAETIAAPHRATPRRMEKPTPAEAIAPVTWPVLAFAVSGVGFVVGGVFGVATLEKKAYLDDLCAPEGNACPPGSEPEQEKVVTYAVTSTAGFAVALASAALGTTLVFVVPDEGGAHGAWIAPLALGVRGGF